MGGYGETLLLCLSGSRTVQLGAGGVQPRRHLKSAQSEVIAGHLMLGERIASQSEMIRTIVADYSPCCGGFVPHPALAGTAAGLYPPRVGLLLLRDQLPELAAAGC